ncbi:MAG: hypothetical protein HQL22_04510 [Candidatus Omnitrophica bacterium]|nr:hypothetical protein [Candidatus Omnitrophota bacterium]
MIRAVFLFIIFVVLSALPPAAGAAVATAPSVPEMPVKADLPALEPDFVYDDHGQRDPFWPLVTAGGAIVTYETNFAVTEMVLEGIVSDGDGGIAIINGTVVEQGKQYGMYTVEKIDPDKVILVKDGQTSELRIKKEE